MDYPKTRKENLAWRVEILRRAQDDILFQAKMKRLFHEDILFAFNAFYYTYDVRKRPLHHIPFITWDYQDEAILELQRSIKEGRDAAVEKTRDMGASWVVLLVFHHEWSDPVGGADFLLGSRIEDYVDKRGDMRTLFEKLRYAHYRIPQWLWPRGFVRRKHDNYAKFQNPETGAVISGESNNPNYGTGGRYAAILYDEFAKWESTDEAAWTSGGDATPCRIAVSTAFAQNVNGTFHRILTDGKTKKILMPWWRHPEKGASLFCEWPPPNEKDKNRLKEHWKPEIVLSSPWRESEKLRRTKDEMDQEIDMKWLGVGASIFGGEAGASLQTYRLLPDEPIRYLEFDLELLKAKEIATLRNREGFGVIYESFDKTHAYVMGVDVVEGIEGGDYASIKVLDRITKNLVASYFSQIDEVLLAKVIRILSDYYSLEPLSPYAPWVGIETNGPGLATFDFTVLLGLSNLFMAPRYDVTTGSVSYKKGWKTDTASRNELIGGIRDYLIDRRGTLNDQRLVEELICFVRSKTGKPQARAGAHDDDVMAFGIALQVDELAPLDLKEAKQARMKYYAELSENLIQNPDPLPNMTTQERCLAQALAANAELREYGQYLRDQLWD